MSRAAFRRCRRRAAPPNGEPILPQLLNLAMLHLAVTEAGVELHRARGHKLRMRRICLILMALVLAVVTTAVPASRAAKLLGQVPAGAPWQELAVQDAAGARGTNAPFKRCQSGAGMLSCPFYRPAVSIDLVRREIISVAAAPAVDSLLTGRTVPPPSRPPKSVSA